MIFGSSGGKQCALGDFVKFGGEGVVHHNHSMLEHIAFLLALQLV
jgi:hypothetical protein